MMSDVTVLNDYGRFVHDGALRMAGYFRTEEDGLRYHADGAAAKDGSYRFVRKIVEPSARAGDRKFRVESHFEKVSA